MIRQKTVFIIGAGASKPYGYPTGWELRQSILTNLSRWKGLLHTELHEAADKFVDVFRKSSNSSIDLFLSRNPEFKEVGKPAIVKMIADYEAQSKFREDVKLEEDWYSFIFQAMTKELISKQDYAKFSDNNVIFVIFNYDRSFEHFLAESFVNSFQGIGGEQLYEVLRKIKIYHVYGKIAPLHWQEKDRDKTISYGRINDARITKLSQNIHVIGEERQELNTLLKQEEIANAEKVFFLGFGYAKENLSILKIPNVLNNTQQIFSSGIGLLGEEAINLRSMFTGGLRWTIVPYPGNEASKKPKPEYVVIESGTSCLDILRKYLFMENKNYLLHLCQKAEGYHS